ncbi:hypothetical protein BDV96DRAFT_580849 [Lophiotrema nucula]|uniref:Uncharacterized protein n=1 Tax=Lophiotrema nucula TaxID=690887 RepID=A0A6A5YZ92_9PLEO|nr:hypothetical protein BDV96DRAFT_580849 [Lophiotrema nucula]
MSGRELISDCRLDINADNLPALKHLEIYPDSLVCSERLRTPPLLKEFGGNPPPLLTTLKIDGLQYDFDIRHLSTITRLLSTLKELSLIRCDLKLCPKIVLLMSNILNYGSLAKFEMQINAGVLHPCDGWNILKIGPELNKVDPVYHRQELIDLAAHHKVPLIIPTVDELEEKLATEVTIFRAAIWFDWAPLARQNLGDYLEGLRNSNQAGT